VHHPRRLRGKGKARFFPYGQGVHVGPQGDHWRATSEPPDHASSADVGLDLNAHTSQRLRHKAGSLYLLKREFRVLVNDPSPASDLVGDGFGTIKHVLFLYFE
jgi:hypothetical protein